MPNHTYIYMLTNTHTHTHTHTHTGIKRATTTNFPDPGAESTKSGTRERDEKKQNEMTMASAISEIEDSLSKWMGEGIVPIDEIQRLPRRRATEGKMGILKPTRKRRKRTNEKGVSEKRRKRGGLKKREILLKYYHHVTQSPNPMQKQALSEMTGNTVKQVTDWFGNARRRLLGKLGSCC